MKNWNILKRHKLPKELATAPRYYVLVNSQDRKDKFGVGHLNLGYERYSSLQIYNDRWFKYLDEAKEFFSQQLEMRSPEQISQQR